MLTHPFMDSIHTTQGIESYFLVWIGVKGLLHRAMVRSIVTYHLYAIVRQFTV